MPTKLDPRRWREHPDFPGYFVSSAGEVVGLRGHKMQPIADKDGYLSCLAKAKDGTKKRLRIHQAVAALWIGKRPSRKHVTRHKNGIRGDNRAKNLCWGTPKENSSDRDRHGKTKRGEAHYRAKLSENDVRAIIAAPEYHGVKEDLGRKYGVSGAMIGYIRRREFWKHV